MNRRARLLIFAAFALIALACVATAMRPVPPAPVAAAQKPEFKPKVWDYPGHNFW